MPNASFSWFTFVLTAALVISFISVVTIGRSSQASTASLSNAAEFLSSPEKTSADQSHIQHYLSKATLQPTEEIVTTLIPSPRSTQGDTSFEFTKTPTAEPTEEPTSKEEVPTQYPLWFWMNPSQEPTFETSHYSSEPTPKPSRETSHTSVPSSSSTLDPTRKSPNDPTTAIPTQEPTYDTQIPTPMPDAPREFTRNPTAEPTEEPTSTSEAHHHSSEPTPVPFAPTVIPTIQIGIGANESSKPNIIFIMADDLSWNAIGYEGFDLNFVTPFMSSIAREGVIMTNYYSQEMCMPARAAFMTGRYPISTGTQYDGTSITTAWGLNVSEVLWPQILQEAGYRTYMLGKWNIGFYSPRYLPTARGFDYYLGYLSAEEMYWSKRISSAVEFHDFMYANTECYAQYNGTDREKYSTFFYRDKAVRIIEEYDFDDDHPMLLYVSFQAVHDPFTDDNTFQNGIPKEYLQESMYENIHANVTGRKRRQYAMALNLMDEAVESIWDAVVSRGQDSNTYLIFASDNGGCFDAGGRNGPLRGVKGTLWEGGTKVDSWIYSPLLSDSVKGTQYGGLMHVTDWFPTLLDLAGVTYTPRPGYALDGYSQVQAWANESANNREYMLYNLYANVNLNSFDIWSDSPVAVRNKRYKLFHAFFDRDSAEWWDYDVRTTDDSTLAVNEDCTQAFGMIGIYQYFLFDLENDPYETTNLYFDEDYTTVVSELNATIAEFSTRVAPDLTATFRKKSAEVAWKDAGNFVSPWVKESSLNSNSAYPEPCSFSSSVVSPDLPSDDDQPLKKNSAWQDRDSYGFDKNTGSDATGFVDDDHDTTRS